MKIEFVESNVSPYVQFTLNSAHTSSQMAAQELFCAITGILDIIANDVKSFCDINAQIVNLKPNDYSVSIAARIAPPTDEDKNQWHKLIEASVNRRFTAFEECKDVLPEISSQCKIVYYGQKYEPTPSECAGKILDSIAETCAKYPEIQSLRHNGSSWFSPNDDEIDWEHEELERYGIDPND